LAADGNGVLMELTGDEWRQTKGEIEIEAISDECLSCHGEVLEIRASLGKNTPFCVIVNT